MKINVYKLDDKICQGKQTSFYGDVEFDLCPQVGEYIDIGDDVYKVVLKTFVIHDYRAIIEVYIEKSDPV